MWGLLHERLLIILKFKFVTQSRATCDQAMFFLGGGKNSLANKKNRLIAGNGKNE